jgi:hypothetical protein
MAASDATAAFSAQSEAAQSFGRLRNDTGIRHLLFLKRNNYGDCKFRELTYLPGEAGYSWNLEKLNYEIAQARNKFMNYSTAEFVRLLLRPNEVLSGILDALVLKVAHNPLGVLLQHCHMGAGCGA